MIRVRVWCEDRVQEYFVRHLLKKLGVDRKSLDMRVAPRGKGSAKRWVEANVHEVVDQRARTRHQNNLRFLMALDGDEEGHVSCIDRLSREAAKLRGPEWTLTDEVLILCPTWSIETWIEWLRGVEVTEEDQLKRGTDESEWIRRSDEAVANWDVPRGDRPDPPSLAAGRKQLLRLLAV